MKCYVIDASIILRFLLEENQQVVHECTSLLRKAEKGELTLLSTSLLHLEVGNGLRFTLKSHHDAVTILKQFAQLPIEIIALTPSQTQKALEISYICKTTVYDASYHMLAIARGCEYITSDKAYFDKAKQLGNIRYIG